MKKLIAVSLAIAILSAGLSIFTLMQHNKTMVKEVEVAGALRIVDDNGWFALDDKLHEPRNIDRIHVQDGFLIVHFTFTASKIHSFIVSPDESFVLSGFDFGASVYDNYVAILVSRIINGRVEPVDASTIRSNLGNVWIYGVFSVEEQGV